MSEEKRTVAERFSEANLATDRFINVPDGEKGARDHDTRYSDPRDAPGTNYGVYSGGGLVDVDIDDYGEDTDESGLTAILDLPDTLTVASPHTDGEAGGHRYYHVTGNVFDTLESAFGKANPQPSWGEVRADNQYVVGPGSELDDCDKEWHDCSEPGEGQYTVANDAPIATISADELMDALRADPDLNTTTADGGDGATGTPKPVDTANYNPAGTSLETVINEHSTVATYLAAGAKAAGFEADSGGGDRSRADYHVCCVAIEHGVPEADVRDRLKECPHSKVGASDAARDYWNRTWATALADCDPNSKATSETEARSIHQKFREAIEDYNLNPNAVATRTDDDGETVVVGIEYILPDDDPDPGDAVITFNRQASKLDGTDKQAVIGRVILMGLCDRGEFFKTEAGRLYYFHDPERRVYRVDDDGRRVLTEEFQGMVWERYKLSAGTFSRNLGKDLKREAQRDAPERAVYRFAHYDEEKEELYVNDFDHGYYAVTPETVEWRPNGTDAFFLSDGRAEAFEYLDPEDRPDLPDEIPGERPMWRGRGDAIMRLFGNRVNYDETAALGPTQQRKQLYLHLHTLPFIDLLNARPIMAWVGEKGSGKTVIERSVGRFIFGEDYSESVMPDSKDDFLAKVSNQALAFVDNYDDGVDWANDILAAVATGAGIDLRKLYSTNELHQEVPRCWLSLTSRDPPFRRDDVADRTLVFRVERVEDGFVGMGDYLKQMTDYRDLLWSTYLDSLQAIVREYKRRDTGTMSSSHRMADWAIFARLIGDTLEVGRVDELLETMETERATFALENESWARVLGRWIEEEPNAAAEYNSAGDIADALESTADAHGLSLNVSHAAGIGSKLTKYREELGELYDLEIDESNRSNKYRFATDNDGHSPTGLGRYV